MERPNKFYECGICNAYHRIDFLGDCRDDSERFSDLPDDAGVYYMEEADEAYEAWRKGGTWE